MTLSGKTAAPDVELTPPATPRLVYRIDDQDRIGFLNEAYLQDAAAGGSVEQVSAGLLGHSLWRVLPQAADWYGPLVRRVRIDNGEVSLPFRCDTPSLRRLMRMHISSMDVGWVQFESSVTAVQPRPSVSLLKAARAPGPGPVVAMCSWCKRVDTGHEWLEVEAAMDVLGLHEGTVLPRVSHGACPRCVSELTALAHSSAATVSIDLP